MTSPKADICRTSRDVSYAHKKKSSAASAGEKPRHRGWVRTFAVIVTDAIELIAEIHDRKPVILTRGDYLHWLSDELDPRRDLMRPFRPKPTWIWPISTRVDKPENDDPSMVEPIEISAA